MISTLVTLIHPRTGDEASFTVQTASDSFADLMAAVRVERIARKLNGFLFSESFPVPF